ncbi:MAG: helix-turn-helix transcriptional regulator [Actinobacteria bacterium]|nr:helix-turn-helix transcriptional regulator [Actinomycetota bacterium]
MARTYSQTQRAEATAATRRAILDAAIGLFREERDPDPSLERVAERAGCSTRSVIRHFGSKEQLIEAAIEDVTGRVAESRRAEPGAVEDGVRKLVDHYEAMGDEVVRWLASAERYPLVRRVTERGTEMHRELIAETFGPGLEGLPSGERRRRLAALATVTDVYVWQLLRRREGLGRAATEAEIGVLVGAALRGVPVAATR